MGGWLEKGRKEGGREETSLVFVWQLVFRKESNLASKKGGVVFLLKGRRRGPSGVKKRESFSVWGTAFKEEREKGCRGLEKKRKREKLGKVLKGFFGKEKKEPFFCFVLASKKKKSFWGFRLFKEKKKVSWSFF